MHIYNAELELQIMEKIVIGKLYEKFKGNTNNNFKMPLRTHVTLLQKCYTSAA